MAPTSHYQSPGLSAMRMCQSSRVAHRLARLLLCLLVLAVNAMIFAPWQQSAKGSGRVVAFAPLERQQGIEAPINGRIVKWGDDIIEGARVTKGQLILEIQDNDPDLLARLENQVRLTNEKLRTVQLKANAYQQQVRDFGEARDMAVKAATQMVSMAQQKLAAERQGLKAAQAAEEQLKLNFQRQRTLANEGITSGLVAEREERFYREAVAKVRQAESYVAAAENELTAKQAELIQRRVEAETKIGYAQAMEQDALGQLALTEKELQELEGRVARQRRQQVLAPRDGTILRLLVNEGGEMVKEGDRLAILVPETAERAVELWVNGNDIPLVRLGDHVRLQFEGWPAVQFAGWPSVAVGTFGGDVVAIDSTDDGRGQFRLLIRPDDEQEWPSERFLRQGVRANGWVLLNQVTLGYEVWRQLNGFPPVLSEEEPKDGSSSNRKTIKLP
jgi:membrane fusion protein, adhesin transport system